MNKDQLDILASLRDSVNEDKASLEADVERFKKKINELSEKNRMQLEHINGLLLEKVNLQSEGIGHREKLLQRERDLGYDFHSPNGLEMTNHGSDLRATLAGKDLPEDVKQRLLAMHEENVTLKESVKTIQDKYVKARQFIRNQDKLFKEQYSSSSANLRVCHQGTKLLPILMVFKAGTFEEAEASFRSQIKLLEEDVARQKVKWRVYFAQSKLNLVYLFQRLMQESTRRYRREQELMLSVLHTIGTKTARQHFLNSSRIEKTSFLSMERNRV